MLACLGALSVIVFFGEPSRGVGTILQPYVVFPLLIWASLRFEERGAVTAILIVAMIAIAGTARGYGPFAQPDLGESLFALQAFTGTVAVCFLMLGAAIAERTRLQATVTAALAGEAASNRAKSDFLAAMSHELRTPLNAIAGYAELLTTGIHGPLSPQQADAIARIDRNQRHLTALLGDVLTFTRSGEQTGSTRLKLENVSVADALQELGAFVEGDLTRQKVSFHVDPPEPSLEVYVDRDKLRQILLNLLVNAIKFSPAGASVSITSRRDGDRVWIAVTDAGPGIPTDQLGRVFEAFYQVERGHTRRYPGLGLGLTIARDLARAMGGDVVIERSDVRGTTASLVLPHAHAVQPSS